MRLKEYDWTEQFIYKYKLQLPPNEQENAYIYNMAVYHYERKAYKKSLLMLHEVRFTDASYHIGAKIIQLKSYYELDESEAFYSLIETFRIYIIRNKRLSDYRKKANLNFLKLAQKTFKFRDETFIFNKKTLEEKRKLLQNEIENLTPLINKTWINQVIDNI